MDLSLEDVQTMLELQSQIDKLLDKKYQLKIVREVMSLMLAKVYHQMYPDNTYEDQVKLVGHLMAYIDIVEEELKIEAELKKEESEQFTNLFGNTPKGDA